MSFRFKSLSFGTALVACLAAPSWSQELAKEVVQEYFDQITRSGMTVAPGPVVESGSVVEWKDVVFGLPEGAGSYALAFIRAEELGGGKVKLTYPENVAFTIDPKGEQPKMDIALSMKGLSHVVSGAKGARMHAYQADAIGVGVTGAEPGLKMNFNLTDVIGDQTDSMIGSGDTAYAHYVAAFKAATMAVKYSVKEGPVNVSADFTYNNISGTVDTDELSQANAGLLFDGSRSFKASFKADSMAGVSDIDQPDMAMTMDIKSGETSAEYAIEDGVAVMNGVGKDALYDVKLKQLPLPPFQMSMDAFDMVFRMPLAKSEEAKAARIKMGLDGLKLSDTIWGMVDPTGALPRDKARLNIDLSAKMKWLVDLMKPEEMAGAAMPATVDSVDINDVTLEIAGARFNGTGSAIIDNSTMPPMPVGEVNLDLKGGIGLLDKLVSLGLLPQEQGQMVKMMSGMFTVPGGDGADHLTSKIEMKEGGAILANGQRIQ